MLVNFNFYVSIKAIYKISKNVIQKKNGTNGADSVMKLIRDKISLTKSVVKQ